MEDLSAPTAHLRDLYHASREGDNDENDEDDDDEEESSIDPLLNRLI
jgi:hypothetical protein